MIKTIRDDMNTWGKANGFVSHVTGFAALLSDLFGAFGGIDSSLLLTTLGVVSLILIFVYRSPVLWILPLLSAIFALSTAGGIIYLLAKKNVITVNGQSQGPYAPEQIQQSIAAGRITGKTLLWAPQLAGWTAAEQLPDWSPYFQRVTPPPLPAG